MNIISANLKSISNLLEVIFEPTSVINDLNWTSDSVPIDDQPTIFDANKYKTILIFKQDPNYVPVTN